jgi:hypothetical protein
MEIGGIDENQTRHQTAQSQAARSGICRKPMLMTASHMIQSFPNYHVDPGNEREHRGADRTADPNGDRQLME